VYGDIHGCYDEFIDLRKKIAPEKNDIEVCVGDIITKGKHSIKTLDYIMKNNIKSVLGNHEDEILRYIKNNKNTIVLDEDKKSIIDKLTDKHVSFLKSLPLYLKFDDVTVVHGGVQNDMNLNKLLKRDVEKVLRLRYVDEKGNYIVRGKEDEKSIFWADVYDGNQGLVVYGHRSFKVPKIDKNAIGIDTGCVYGNKLSAVVFEYDKKNNNIYKNKYLIY